MNEQNNKEEIKMLKTFFAQRVLENVYGLNPKLAKPVASILTNSYNKLMENFDYKKVKKLHYQSTLNFNYKSSAINKVFFYIGLMDKDTLTYKYSKDEAIIKIINTLGECTIHECIGCYKNKNSKNIKIKTFEVIKFMKEIPKNFVHNKVKELKQIFNQDSIITEVISSYQLDFNKYSKEYEDEIEEIMKEYDFDWNEAVSLYNTGLT